MKVENAKVIEIGEVQKGTSKAGKEWSKLTFVVQTDETYNNVYPIEIFGSEKIENFNKYTKVDDRIDVDFNISASSYEGRWFTKLSYWKSFKAQGNTQEVSGPVAVPEASNSDDLPF